MKRMRHTGGGYTLIEVMIFLAISGLLFVSAAIAVGGQQAHTEFKTGTTDVSTKLQQWIDQVINGYSASSAAALASQSDLKCQVAAGRPQLQQVLAGTGLQRGGNADCIFLGKAIQVTDDDNKPPPDQDPTKIYAYSVLGLRLNATNDLSTSLADAAPAPAFDPSATGNQTDLTETYTIPNGTRVKWVKSGPSLNNLTGTSHLAGFYTSFSNGSSAQAQNGSQSLIAVQYPVSANRIEYSTAITDCIEILATCGAPTGPDPATNPWPMGQWVICLESTRNSDTAAVYVGSTNGNGATTKVVVPCP